MTEAQQGIWFAQSVDVGNPVFNTGQYVSIHGALDIASFEAAVNTAMQEANGLRVQAIEIDGAPALIQRPSAIELTVVDVSATEYPRDEALVLMQQDMQTPVDLARDALVAQQLFILDVDSYLWYQRIHHLVIDGYGTSILNARVFELYGMAMGDEVTSTRALASIGEVQGADAEYANAARRDDDRAYWHNEFAGFGGAAGFTSGQAISAHRYLHQEFALPVETASAVQALATQANATWPDVLVALTGAFVKRHIGENEAVLGVPTMNRLGTPAARVPAMVMNVLPIRVAVDEDIPTVDFVRHVSLKLRTARKHGRYRSEQLQRDLGLVGADRRLYGPMVNILPFDAELTMPGATCSMHLLGTGPVDDITFNFRGDGSGSELDFDIDANPRHYTSAELAAIANRFSSFLKQALQSSTISECATVTTEERVRLLDEFNNTAHSVREASLTTLIEEAMFRWPNNAAVTFERDSLTYRELDALSTKFAVDLAASGIGRDSVVAVSVPRSLELIVALVGILRAGAAYLPLDVACPIERIRKIVDSAMPHAVVVTEVDEQWKSLGIPTVVARELLAKNDQPASLNREIGPDDAAYVIYTSGSTGTPKGVVVEHRAIVNRLEWMRAQYAINRHDRVLHKTPTTFDVSVWELFLPLIVGAELVVAPPAVHRDPVAIAKLVREHRISAMHFVPSMLDAFLEEPTAIGLKIERVFCSGEELRASQRVKFHKTVRGELHNLYGPTEAAVDVTYWEASRTDTTNPIPIGRPVWNTQMFVLDERQRLVPEGVVGKLYIGGVQLARGYLGQPELTASRFVVSPFSEGRLYDTGDLARWRHDGAIEFLGRADFQVKIRGQRVELGEIESTILTSAPVQSVCVLLREDQAGDQRLVAYFVPADEAVIDVAALRVQLGAQLLTYMIPSSFVEMDAMPLTSSGKLDRKALPRPTEDIVEVDQETFSATELAVVQQFAESLSVAPSRIGRDSDFFDLGGHSLLAVRALARLRDRFGVQLSLGSIFAHPTVARMTAHIESMLNEVSASNDAHGLDPLLSLSLHTDRIRLFTIHPAGGISWCYSALARSLGREFSVFGLQARGLTQEHALPTSLRAMAADYVAQIREVQNQGPYHLAGWSVGGIIAQEIACQLRDAGQGVGIVALLDSYPSDYWRNFPEPPDGAAIKALLLIAGFDPTALEDIVSMEQAIELLRSSDHPLGSLSDDALQGVVRVVANNNALVRGHHHAKFDGRLVHFRAALDHAGEDLSPQQWAAYSTSIETYDIQSVHAFMVSPASSATIAAELKRLMQEKKMHNDFPTTLEASTI